jgi:plastocyanin
MRTVALTAIFLASLSLAGVSALAAPSRQTHRTKLRLAAKPGISFHFTRTRLRARAGIVQLVMRNPSSAGLRHGIAVEGHHVDKHGKQVKAGGTSTVRVRLRPGRYTFYCPVDSHRSLGMRGVLVVRR